MVRPSVTPLKTLQPYKLATTTTTRQSHSNKHIKLSHILVRMSVVAAVMTRCCHSFSLRMMATNSRELRFFKGPVQQHRIAVADPETAMRWTTATTTTTTATTTTNSCHHFVVGSMSVWDRLLQPQQQQQYHTATAFAASSNSRLFYSTDSESSESHKSTASTTASQQQQLSSSSLLYSSSISLTDEERELFSLLRRVREETKLQTTLRVAGGWVRDKLLATPEFQAYHAVFEIGNNNNNNNNNGLNQTATTKRLTSKFRKSSFASMGRQGTKVLFNSNNKNDQQQPVDIDIALDDMLGREFADHLNEYLSAQGHDTVSVGVVLKNPEKSKHLETATMKVGNFWLDCVNLRAEAYSSVSDSRIPDLMRIGTPSEDAYRRDLTINSLFYNVNTGQVEDWTGRGFDDLRKGIVATPLPPLTTLLDDPLRVLRSIRFAARLRFSMDEQLVGAAKDVRVKNALDQKVSRERVGGEIDLMFRSPDPVGAMRLLMNLNLIDTVFPLQKYTKPADEFAQLFSKGLQLLSCAHDHLEDCKLTLPVWCMKDHCKSVVYGAKEAQLTRDGEARRILWYAAFFKPFYDASETKHQQQQQSSRKTNRSDLSKLLVDDLKRPIRDADAIERVVKAAHEFTTLLSQSGCDVSAMMILLSNIKVQYSQEEGRFTCSMNGREVDTATEDDPVWLHAMEFRSLCFHVMQKVGPLWRAALFLSLAEQLAKENDDEECYRQDSYCFIQDDEDENDSARQLIIERYDTFATALLHTGLVGIWEQKALLDGEAIVKILPNLPKGPNFRVVMEEQTKWITAHPPTASSSTMAALTAHLQERFPEFCRQEESPSP